MRIDLKHRFFTGNTPAQGFWAEQVFKDVNSLNTFTNRLTQLSFPSNIDDLNGHRSKEVFGDGGEALTEIIFKTFGLHPDLRCEDIQVCPPGQQGVDFIGTHSINGKPVTIQTKWVGNSRRDEELQEDEEMKLERFLKVSQNEFGVPVDYTDNMIVITNAKDIHYFTNDQLLYSKVRCINNRKLKYLTHGKAFWDHCRAQIQSNNPYIKF